MQTSLNLRQWQAAKASAAQACIPGTAPAVRAGISIPFEDMTATLSIARGEFAGVLAAAGLDGSGRFRSTLCIEALFRKPANALRSLPSASARLPEAGHQLQLAPAHPLQHHAVAAAQQMPPEHPPLQAAMRQQRPPLRFQQVASPPPPTDTDTAAAVSSADLKRRRGSRSIFEDASPTRGEAVAPVDETFSESLVVVDAVVPPSESSLLHAPSNGGAGAYAECAGDDPGSWLRSTRSPFQSPRPFRTARALADRPAHGDEHSTTPKRGSTLSNVPQVGSPLLQSPPVAAVCAEASAGSANAVGNAAAPQQLALTVPRPDTSHSERLRPPSPCASRIVDDDSVPVEGPVCAASLAPSSMPRVSAAWASALEGLM